jgi:hypothetical protein
MDETAPEKKSIWGTLINAVKIQVYCAVIA